MGSRRCFVSTPLGIGALRRFGAPWGGASVLVAAAAAALAVDVFVITVHACARAHERGISGVLYIARAVFWVAAAVLVWAGPGPAAHPNTPLADAARGCRMRRMQLADGSADVCCNFPCYNHNNQCAVMCACVNLYILLAFAG